VFSLGKGEAERERLSATCKFFRVSCLHYFGFALLCSLIGLKNVRRRSVFKMHHLLDQSEKETKPIATCSQEFSRAWYYNLHRKLLGLLAKTKHFSLALKTSNSIISDNSL